MNIQISCSYCGATQTILCKQLKGYAGVFRSDKTFASRQQILYHDICKECGTVVRSFITDPDKL